MQDVGKSKKKHKLWHLNIVCNILFIYTKLSFINYWLISVCVRRRAINHEKEFETNSILRPTQEFFVTLTNVDQW